jgi:ATP-dependent 26S proteasome regulatory subunit
MDEIDSIGSARMEAGNGNGDSEVQRTMLELLNQLDGFEASNKIKVFHLDPLPCLWNLLRLQLTRLSQA